MTIFGFNSAVQCGGAQYHVQSEARQHDLLLQTLIFVQGQAVGKHTYSYAAQTLEAGFSEEAIHELLKAQHKSIIDALHEGRMDLVAGRGAEVYDVGGSTLGIKWTNASAASSKTGMIMTFQVQDSGQPVKSAEVVIFPCPPGRATVLARTITNASGDATLAFQPTPEVEHEASVMVRATHGSASATRKFRFKK